MGLDETTGWNTAAKAESVFPEMETSRTRDVHGHSLRPILSIQIDLLLHLNASHARE